MLWETKEEEKKHAFGLDTTQLTFALGALGAQLTDSARNIIKPPAKNSQSQFIVPN